MPEGEITSAFLIPMGTRDKRNADALGDRDKFLSRSPKRREFKGRGLGGEAC